MGIGAHVMTTVTCLFVQGEYPYTAEYVTKLYAMVARWIDRPFRFVCLTDRPWLFNPPIETIPITKLAGFAPWTKLELFNPVRRWKGRVLYLDLDTLIVSSLAPILDIQAEFAITADPPSRNSNRTIDAYSRKIVRRFNSSVMVWDGGTQTDLYTAWTPKVARDLSGDQDWTGLQKPDATTMPRAWFPRISEVVRPPWPKDAKVILVKVPKNHIVAQESSWFSPWWGAA